MDFSTAPENIPRLPGAYVLAVELARPTAVRLGNRAPLTLPAGRYLYCGSANGPGGLQARIARHMRRGKAMRWHIDQLTEAGRVLGAWTFIGARECDLVAALAPLPAPIEGFGSSDCRRCRSHLLFRAECSQDTALREIEDLIGRGILRKDPGGGRSTSWSPAEC